MSIAQSIVSERLSTLLFRRFVTFPPGMPQAAVATPRPQETETAAMQGYHYLFRHELAAMFNHNEDAVNHIVALRKKDGHYKASAAFAAL